jgi:transposase
MKMLFGASLKMSDERYRSKEWLQKKYSEEKMSGEEISDLCGVGSTTIYNWLERFGIERRDMGETRRLRYKEKDVKYNDEDWLRQKYWGERLSSYAIAELCDVSGNTIHESLKRHGIDTRTQEESTRTRFGDKDYYDKEWLYNQYVRNGKSTVKIASECDVSSSTIRNALKRHDIEIRSFSEAQANRNQRGENSPVWNGGRPYHYGPDWEEMRDKTIERDNGECRVCGMTRQKHQKEYGSDIHVHHIQPIATFDNLENANRLDNLITLCYPDHRKWEGIPLRPQ